MATDDLENGRFLCGDNASAQDHSGIPSICKFASSVCVGTAEEIKYIPAWSVAFYEPALGLRWKALTHGWSR